MADIGKLSVRGRLLGGTGRPEALSQGRQQLLAERPRTKNGLQTWPKKRQDHAPQNLDFAEPAYRSFVASL